LERVRQTLEEILSVLSVVESSWQDSHSEAVIQTISAIPKKDGYTTRDIELILDRDFKAGLTAIRLTLDMSKDEFVAALKLELGEGGSGIKRFQSEREQFLTALGRLGVLRMFKQVANTPVSWRDILVERLKTGRGSAIKGQRRGRHLEEFAEAIVRQVFGENSFDVRCRFTGAKGASTEKADFAIPSKKDPAILIEVKAYGATGSKQTDILGDIRRIVNEKRNDTQLLLVTDGVAWKARQSDLQKLVDMQNTGLITRIYTHKMEKTLGRDLRRLRKEYGL